MSTNQRVFGSPLNVERPNGPPARSAYAMAFYDENSVPPSTPFSQLSQTERMRVLLDEVSRELNDAPRVNLMPRGNQN